MNDNKKLFDEFVAVFEHDGFILLEVDGKSRKGVDFDLEKCWGVVCVPIPALKGRL